MRARRHEDHDPEYIVRRAPTGDAHSDLPMFSGAAPWPETPTVQEAGSEPLSLEMPGSVDARYADWRLTSEGAVAYQWFAKEALGMVARGATRLFVDSLAWQYRGATGGSFDNSFRAPLVRELVREFPILNECFEQRVRRSA